MGFYRKNWYYFGAIYFVAISFSVIVWHNSFSVIRLLLIMSFMALLVHQFEEYAKPGGFPSIFNTVVLGEKKIPNHYPLNPNSAMITNVYLGYTFYIIPIFFPNLIWLGIAQIMFGIFQIIIHGIVINIKLKSLYNPGLASVILLHFPIGIYYINYVVMHNLANAVDFIIGIALTLVAGFIIIFIPVKFGANKESKYHFSDIEMGGFAKEKVAKIRNS